MKKLILATLVIMTTILNSCSNESLTGTTEQNQEKTNKTASKEIDYLAKDGNIYLLGNGVIYYMGELQKDDMSEDARIAQKYAADFQKDQLTSRRATNQCWFSMGGEYVILTQVSGSGQGSTYWITTITADGTMTTIQNPGYSCSTIQNHLISHNGW